MSDDEPGLPLGRYLVKVNGAILGEIYVFGWLGYDTAQLLRLLDQVGQPRVGDIIEYERLGADDK